MPQPAAKQLELSPQQKQELKLRIRDDWSLDSRDMQKRNNSYQRWYRLWRAAEDNRTFPVDESSNFHIPLTQWNVLAKLAKEIDALLGDDAEVVVRPVGPSDARLSPKIQRYLNWRVKISLKLFEKLYNYLLQKIVLGTTIAFMPWVRKERTVRKRVSRQVEITESVVDPETGLPSIQPRTETVFETREEIIVDFEGPDLITEDIEEWAIPPDAKSIEDADHFERRLRLSVDQMLEMADDNKLDKSVLKGDNLKKLRELALTETVEDTEVDSGKVVREEKREQESLPTQAETEGREEKLTVINWNGNWRSKTFKPEERAEDIVAFYQPDLQLLLGVSRLVDIFPDGRRPFIKSAAIKDVNRFWGIGLPELLETTNKAMDIQHQALTDASVYALGPLILYEPASGFNPQSFKYEPWTTLAVADASKVKVVNLASNLNLGPVASLQPAHLSYAERVSGLTEAELGRPFAQPNAPRTVGQQQIIQFGSTVRLLLDLRLERESLREMLHRIWDMDKRFLPKPIFFRVSETDEFEELTEEEMMGEFDFDIGPLTSTSNKFEETSQLLQAYALNLQNPVVAQNPALLSGFVKKINDRLGQGELNALIPDFKQLAQPLDIDTENVMLLEGQDVDPHPQDNHRQHIAKHNDFKLRMSEVEVFPGVTVVQQNPGLVGRIDSHIAEHEAALRGGVVPQISPPFGPNGGATTGVNLPTDQTGQPAPGENALKSQLNQGLLNLG